MIIWIYFFHLQIVYAMLTLKRWSNAIFSYGLIGIVAVILTVISVALGLSISNLKISPVSIQVSDIPWNIFKQPNKQIHAQMQK